MTKNKDEQCERVRKHLIEILPKLTEILMDYADKTELNEDDKTYFKIITLVNLFGNNVIFHTPPNSKAYKINSAEAMRMLIEWFEVRINEKIKQERN